MDSDNDKTMTGLLAAGRCDYLVKNNYNTPHVFAYRNICDKTIYQSPIATNVLPLTVVMRPALKSFKPILDGYIKAMKDSGELQNLLHRYSPEPTFPMAPRCK
ncbi:hypothetical protein [Alteromonas facilis]|uniref:hypothetical protein n=1 Tax=Alteromonas facilis TaxID=2048004 RepID=UPI000F5C65ED|nr:hypothetical protein [Alteromonas facilis]